MIFEGVYFWLQFYSQFWIRFKVGGFYYVVGMDYFSFDDFFYVEYVGILICGIFIGGGVYMFFWKDCVQRQFCLVFFCELFIIVIIVVEVNLVGIIEYDYD